MDNITRTDLRELVEQDGKWHVSLYMPVHPVGRDQQQDSIRLKNLMNDAEKKLLEFGVRRPDVQKMFAPAEDLLLDREFWQQPGDGLAIFLSDEFSKIHRLPGGFEEQVVVSHSFHVKPLLPLLIGNGDFYILAISLNRVRLFKASRDSVMEMELRGMPTNMEDALQIEDVQNNLGFHTDTATPKGGERPAIYYGQGVEENRKDDILQYFHKVDEGLAHLLQDKSAPMVVAGVDYLLPLYRSASTYRNLLEEGILGNPDRQDRNELHAQAWKIVEPIFMRNQQEALDRFAELYGQQKGLASSDLEPVVRAAVGGRVETLIVPLGMKRWGQYDPEHDSVRVDPEPTPWNVDLLNFAAVQTLLNSGDVYAVPQDRLPNHEEIAAIYRYAI
jgi:release factor family 7